MGGKWKQWHLNFLGSKITVHWNHNHEIKRFLLLGRKAMTSLDSMLKSRDITLQTKVCIVKAMVFPVMMFRCESWTVKKAEHRRIDALELWCWRKLLRVPWTARRSQSWRKSTLNIRWKGWCWNWSSSTLASWCEELTHWKRPWCWVRLIAGGEGGDREWHVGCHHWINGHAFEQTHVWESKLRTGKPGVLQSTKECPLIP